MLEQDYLMRIFLQFAEILRRSWFKARDEHDPKAAADMLENAVGDAVDIDGATLLSLALRRGTRAPNRVTQARLLPRRLPVS